MTIYCYKACACGAPELDKTATFDTRNDQTCDECGELLEQDLRRKWASQQVSISPYWLKVTSSDFLPDSVKGAAPFSKAKLDYAEKTQGEPSRWGRPHDQGHRV